MASFHYLSCSNSSDDPGPTLSEEEKQVQRLAKTWQPGTVNLGPENVSDRFSGFELVLTDDKQYTTNGSLGDFDIDPFDATGSWEFKGGNINTIVRNDGVEMNLIISESSLTLTFSIESPEGKIAGIGEYQFQLEASN